MRKAHMNRRQGNGSLSKKCPLSEALADPQMSSMEMKTGPNDILSQRKFLVGVEKMSDK